ncbi:MAG TPA: hypothetical protein VG734_25535 [Lacunisphaera sp.]|nr:hypothetical protein [Lacunisphaera sp.]
MPLSSRPPSIPPRTVRARQRRLAFRLREQVALLMLAETEAARKCLAAEFEATKAELAAARLEHQP